MYLLCVSHEACFTGSGLESSITSKVKPEMSSYLNVYNDCPQLMYPEIKLSQLISLLQMIAELNVKTNRLL